MKHLIALLTVLPLPAIAEFPRDKVQYVCDTAGYYITVSRERCMLEQYEWYTDVMAMGLTDKQYSNALWYGQKLGYMGDVIGIDFKYVYDRARYITDEN